MIDGGGGLLDRVRERLTSADAVPTPEAVADALRAESGGVLGDAALLEALGLLQTELTGAGPLDALLAEPDVTDVLVTGPDAVWVDDGGGLRRSEVGFPSEGSVRSLAQRLAIMAGHRLDDGRPWVDGRIPGVDAHGHGIRLHAILPPVSAGGTCISLRVLRPASTTLADLEVRGSVGPEAGAALRAVIAARLAFLVVGGTGSGKTTLLNALLGEVDGSERIVCVEDPTELAPRHPHVVRLVARPANVEGAGEVTLRDLVRQALRMRPDRLVVGEVRGAEVVDLLAALNTGHEGGAGTVHANSAAELPARLEALAALGGMGREALHSQVAAAVRVVLTVRRDMGGRRVLEEIGIVVRDDRGLVRVECAWDRSGRREAWGALVDLLREHLREGVR